MTTTDPRTYDDATLDRLIVAATEILADPDYLGPTAIAEVAARFDVLLAEQDRRMETS